MLLVLYPVTASFFYFPRQADDLHHPIFFLIKYLTVLLSSGCRAKERRPPPPSTEENPSEGSKRQSSGTGRGFHPYKRDDSSWPGGIAGRPPG